MIEEIKLREKNLQEYVDKQKRAFSSMFETDNVKLVGIRFYFLIDDEICATQGAYSKGFDPEEWEADTE